MYAPVSCFFESSFFSVWRSLRVCVGSAVATVEVRTCGDAELGVSLTVLCFPVPVVTYGRAVVWCSVVCGGALDCCVCHRDSNTLSIRSTESALPIFAPMRPASRSFSLVTWSSLDLRSMMSRMYQWCMKKRVCAHSTTKPSSSHRPCVAILPLGSWNSCGLGGFLFLVLDFTEMKVGAGR